MFKSSNQNFYYILNIAIYILRLFILSQKKRFSHFQGHFAIYFPNHDISARLTASTSFDLVRKLQLRFPRKRIYFSINRIFFI